LLLRGEEWQLNALEIPDLAEWRPEKHCQPHGFSDGYIRNLTISVQAEAEFVIVAQKAPSATTKFVPGWHATPYIRAGDLNDTYAVVGRTVGLSIHFDGVTGLDTRIREPERGFRA
jgi:hypothetical protein